MRAVFSGLVMGAVGVLALDLNDLAATNGWWATPSDVAAPAQPILPPAVDVGGPVTAPDPRPFVSTPAEELAQPMRFELQAGGLLVARGSIEPGTAQRLAEELETRGEYVKTVALDSPGGSLDDAMAMARDLRARKLDAEVADGALCASSCPLLLAGGAHRHAGPQSAVGVHQFYAAVPPDRPVAQVMADAQLTTARITRHLTEMGVDPALWLHALETPPRALRYLTGEEMKTYRLVTPR